ATWQLTVWALWGEVPGLTSLPAPGERLLGFPFVGVVEGAQKWGVIDLAGGVALLVVVWIGATHFRKGTLPGTAFLAYVALMLCLGWPVWESWRGFARATVELVLMVFVLWLAPSTTAAAPGEVPTPTPKDSALDA